MRAIKGHNTMPELAVRKLAHKMGYRFRLHRKDLPGRPDIVFPGLHKAIFVHGCFWHGHDCSGNVRIPRQNTEYWKEKLSRNKERDKTASKALVELGWEVGVFWECELKDQEALLQKLHTFLTQDNSGENKKIIYAGKK